MRPCGSEHDTEPGGCEPTAPGEHDDQTCHKAGPDQPQPKRQSQASRKFRPTNGAAPRKISGAVRWRFRPQSIAT